MAGKVYLGLDIGGTKCAVLTGTANGEVIDKISFATKEPEGPEQAIRNLIEASNKLVSERNLSLDAIGISCGSPLDPERGIIQAPPNLSSWKDVEIVRIFQEHFKAPAFLDNDANAGAIAEYSFGAGRGFKNIIFITFGTGCGAGLILDGRIYRGTNCYAGEIGHIRVEKDGPIGYHKSGSLEGFCSGGGIAQLAVMMKKDYRGATRLGEAPSAKDVGEAAEAGDELALRIFEKSGEMFGRGLAYLLDIINPQRILVGSIFLRCEKFIRPAMERTLKAESLPYTYGVCEVLPVGLGERIGDLAALSVAHYGLSESARR